MHRHNWPSGGDRSHEITFFSLTGWHCTPHTSQGKIALWKISRTTAEFETISGDILSLNCHQPHGKVNMPSETARQGAVPSQRPARKWTADTFPSELSWFMAALAGLLDALTPPSPHAATNPPHHPASTKHCIRDRAPPSRWFLSLSFQTPLCFFFFLSCAHLLLLFQKRRSTEGRACLPRRLCVWFAATSDQYHLRELPAVRPNSPV